MIRSAQKEFFAKRMSTISWEIVSLRIFNVLGQEIATLVNEERSAGWKEGQWNARQTSRGQAKDVSSGIYLNRLKANNYVETKKLLFLK